MNTTPAICFLLLVNIELRGVLVINVSLVLGGDGGAGVGCRRRQLQHVEFLKLVAVFQLVNFLLSSLEGGKGSASGCLGLVSPCLHTDV